MATGIQAWSTTAADNATADASVNWAEGQTPASINNSARAMMASLAAFYDTLGGGTTFGGSANAYTITNPAVGAWSAYDEGLIIGLEANHSNNGAATVNVDGLGAKSIVKGASTALATGDLVSGAFYLLRYNGTEFQLVGAVGAASFQPLDATLTALALLSWASGSPVIQFTAADTVSLTLTPSVTSVTVGDGSAASPGVKFASNSGVYYATNLLGFSVNGTLAAWLDNNLVLNITGAARAGDGSVSAPGLSFRSDTNNGWYRIGTDNWAGAVGGSKFMDISATLVDFTVASRGPMAVSAETSGTLTAAASANKQVLMSADCTINDGVFAANDWIFFSNDAGTTKQIIADTGMTLRLHGTTTTGTRTIALRGGAAVRFNSASDATVYGDVT